MTFQTLDVAVDDGMATVTIDQPDTLNALSRQVMNDLDAWFAWAAAAPVVEGVLLTGAGPKSFVAGADIKQFKDMGPEEGKAFAERGQAVFSRIERFPKPVIAVVNGFALGGGSELALACHMRVASKNARFGQPEVNLGIIPGYGGTQRLPRIVGKGLATELVLTGEMISADRAYEIGLVNHVFEPEDLMEGARKLLRGILTKAPRALTLTLEALAASDLPVERGLQYEAALFGQACATEDFEEGVDAFLGRRQPEFKGR
ncbi:MAG: enoyl-CoA hydratase [Bacteroidetes bacterium CG12_big_fil_rev_8_21_14_0_65_60_17]|nr:MAG: enoyl-CoA hydratase [Bacteroidetes bacterium CG12_big_fil_rev_8_21_14_0_65_60_17]